MYYTDSDGGVLDPLDVGALEIAVQRNASGGLQLRTTEVAAEIVYFTPEPGVALLQSAALLILACWRRARP